MSTFIAPPALRRTGVPLLRSAARFHFLAARRSLDAITGQVGTLVRAATGTSLDSNGATITWPHSAARGEVRTVSGATRYGLRMGADDLTWPCDFGLEAATFYVEFVQLGAAIASGAGVAYCGRDDQTGDRVSIQGAAANALVVNLNLTAGLFGMNVGGIPLAEDPEGFWRVLLLVLLMTAGAAWYAFRRGPE